MKFIVAFQALCIFGLLFMFMRIADGAPRLEIPLAPVMLNELNQADTAGEILILSPVPDRQALAEALITFEPAVAPEEPEVTVEDDLRDTIADLRAVISKLKKRTWEHRGCELVGPLGDWVKLLHPADVKPEPEQLHKLRWIMDELEGVKLTREEGLWLIERDDLDDWQNWGATYTQALSTYLGYDRLAAELTANALAELDNELDNS